jgi:hypothetical protein
MATRGRRGRDFSPPSPVALRFFPEFCDKRRFAGRITPQATRSSESG